MIDAFRIFVPYSQTLSSNIVLEAYYRGHESGSRHAWAYAGKSGGPPAWPDDGPGGELMEPEEDEQDAAMERDADELEAVAEQCNAFLPEVLDELERRCVKEAFGIWTGYAAFCEESAGVSAENLAAVVLEPVVGGIEDMRAVRSGWGWNPTRISSNRCARGWRRRGATLFLGPFRADPWLLARFTALDGPQGGSSGAPVGTAGENRLGLCVWTPIPDGPTSFARGHPVAGL